MKQDRTPHRLAIGLLLAATALPLSPLLAQDAQAPVDIDAPAAPEAPTATPAPSPPAAEAPAPEAEAPAAEPAADAEAPAAEEAAPVRQRRAARTAPARPRVAAPRAAAPVRETAPAPVAIAPAPAPVDDIGAAPADAPLAEAPVAAAPAPEAVPADPAATETPTETEDGGNNGPLLLLAALAIGGIAAAVLIARRRRRRSEVAYEDHRSYHEPVPAAAAEPPAGVALAGIAAAPAAAAVAAPAVSAPVERPWIDLVMRPVRAGVGEEAARVEFELSVDNRGSAPAEDVRISAFMLSGGSPEQSEAERTLIDRPAEATLPGSIDPGDGKRIAATVALPREKLTDAILPVVVADARYRLPDGSEGRTSASYAVGVPWQGELAHFDVENPSGLHEGVEARLQGEPERT